MSASTEGPTPDVERIVRVATDGVELEGMLQVPASASGIVAFAHGSGSSRHSPRNQHVAKILRDGRLGTLLFDLLTSDEEAVDRRTRHLRFDIPMLAGRVAGAVDWLMDQADTADHPVGLFGSSTGAAAALVAAAERPDRVAAVVSRGGRPDLAGDALPEVRAPTLLLVGGRDDAVIGLNKEAMERMRGSVHLELIPGAGHLFEAPGTLDEVAHRARDFFAEHLAASV